MFLGAKCLRNKSRTKGEGWSTAPSWSPLPVILFAGYPKAALLFLFFGGFRCCVWLFIVLLVRYYNKNRK